MSSAEGSAETARSSVVSPRELRSFFISFGGVFFGLCAGAVALALLVDPLGFFGTGVVEPIVWPDRDRKAELFLQQPSPPSTLVLGTSRAMKINPRCVDEVLGDGHTFNFAVNSAHAEDHLAILRFALAQSGGTALRRVIVGTDVETFHNGILTDDRLRGSKHLRALSGIGRASPREIGSAIFGGSSLHAGFKSLMHELFEPKVPDDMIFQNDGFLIYRSWDADIERGTFPFQQKTQDAVSKADRMETYTALAPDRVQTFKQFLELAASKHVAVEAFIPPFQPEVRAVLEPTNYAKRLAELEAQLTSWGHAGLLKYHTTHHVTDFGGTPEGFYDGVHMTEPNSNKLLLALFDKAHGCGL